MLRKFLIVGLGGSGGKTLRFLRAELLAWLESIGWNEGMPDGWQLLHIDSPTTQDGAEITEVPMLPADNYRGLVGSGITIDTIDKVIVGATATNPGDLASSRIDPVTLPVPLDKGAGQYRAVGRAIGLAYADVILTALKSAKTRVMGAEASAQLNEISSRAGFAGPGAADAPVCVVVSSLAGGTGAGLVLDTCDLLRQLDSGGSTWGDKSFGILFCSDVFGEVDPLQAGGIAPNTMAAASEFLNGYWMRASFERTNATLSSKGAMAPVARSGPAYPFLVGASSPGGLSFGSQRDLYRMMGRALCSWVTDPAIQSRVVSYEQANWQNSSRQMHSGGIVWEAHDGAFSAFGYAEVNLGTDRFEDYATRRIARVAADWLREAHLVRALAADPNTSTPPDVIVEEAALEELVPFLRDAGLLERGKDNQVIDRLIPDDADGLYAAQLSNLTSLVTTGASKMTSTAWGNEIGLHLLTVADEYDRRYDEGMRAKAATWVNEAPDRIVAALSRLLTRVGFSVAERTLQLSRSEIESVIDELQGEAQQHLTWAADFRGAIQSRLDFGSGAVEATHPKVIDAIAEGLWTKAGYEADAKRRQLAVGLLREFVSGVVAPLASAVSAARANLELRGYGGDGSEPEVLRWPVRAVPDHMAPPKNELLVIPVAKFPERFDFLVERSTRAEFDVEQLEEYRSAVISGEFMDEIDPKLLRAPRPIVVQGRWRPDPTLLLGAAEMRSSAVFGMNFLPDDLVARAREWLRRSGTASRRFLDSDLRSYLGDEADPDPAERNDRRSAFKVAFETALRTAEPLVRIHPGLKAQLHPKVEQGVRVVPSQIPLQDHPLEGDVREIVNRIMGPGSADGEDVTLTTAPGVRRIAISSTLGAPHDPMVFSSIFEPIASSWATASPSPVSRASFWLARRGRPISEFVPASQELILAMTRGWMTALFLGLIDRPALQITDGRGRYGFPNPLLTSVSSDSRDLLPAVLEAMILAHAQVMVRDSLDPLKAYVVLRELGTSEDAVPGPDGMHFYPKASPLLGEWIRTGTSPQPIGSPLLDLDGLRVQSPEERTAAWTAFAAEVLADYGLEDDEFRTQAVNDPSRYLSRDGNLRFGMMSLIKRALNDLAGLTVKPAEVKGVKGA